MGARESPRATRAVMACSRRRMLGAERVSQQAPRGGAPPPPRAAGGHAPGQRINKGPAPDAREGGQALGGLGGGAAVGALAGEAGRSWATSSSRTCVSRGMCQVKICAADADNTPYGQGLRRI